MCLILYMILDSIQFGMMHLKLLQLLYTHQMMDILLKVIASLKTHVCINIHPANRIDEDLALLSILIELMLQSPAIKDSKCLGALHDGSHFVNGFHDDVFVGIGKPGWKMEEHDFGNANFFVGAESWRWVVGGLERNVKHCKSFFSIEYSL